MATRAPSAARRARPTDRSVEARATARTETGARSLPPVPRAALRAAWMAWPRPRLAPGAAAALRVRARSARRSRAGRRPATAIASRTTAAAFPSQALDEAKHTCWCLVRDSVNGEPLANRDFVADIGGLKQSGKTDGQGYAKIETSGGQPFNIHVTFSSPKRVLKPGQGN